jgi:hypothetical protein
MFIVKFYYCVTKHFEPLCATDEVAEMYHVKDGLIEEGYHNAEERGIDRGHVQVLVGSF